MVFGQQCFHYLINMTAKKNKRKTEIQLKNVSCYFTEVHETNLVTVYSLFIIELFFVCFCVVEFYPLPKETVSLFDKP